MNPLAPRTFSRSPAEHYIRYVLTADSGNSITTLLATLKKEVLFPTNDLAYLEGLASEFETEAPKPFLPKDMRHIPSQVYLDRVGIWDLWHPDRATFEAHRIHNTPSLREPVMALLSCGLQVDDIVKYLEHKHGENVLPESIKGFGRFFWNLGLLTPSERELLYEEAQVSRLVRDAGLGGFNASNQVRVLQELHVDPKQLQLKNYHDIAFQVAARSVLKADTIQDPYKRADAVLKSILGMNAAMRCEQMHLDRVAAEGQGQVKLKLKAVDGESITASQLALPGAVFRSLPGRPDLQVIEGEYTEVGKGKNHGNRTG